MIRPFLFRSLLGISLLPFVFGTPSPAATTYTWQGAGGGNWSTTSNWTPGGKPGAGDTALINGASSADQTVVYDPGAGGNLGTLSLATSSPYVNTLDLSGINLTIASALTLGASNGGTSDLWIDTASASRGVQDNAGIILNSEGRIDMGGYAGSNAVSANLNAGSPGLQINSGGLLNFLAPGNAAPAGVSVSVNISGPVNLNGGTIMGNFVSDTSSNHTLNVSFTGNFTSTGGTIGTSGTGATEFNGMFMILGGMVNQFNGTTFANPGVTWVEATTNGASLQGTALPIVEVRNITGGSTVTAVTLGNVGGTTPLSIYTLFYNDTSALTAGGGTTVKLSSDVVDTVAAPGVQGGYAAVSPVYTLDANGYTFDLSGIAGGFAASKGSNGSVNWVLTSTSTSGTGVIKADHFNFTAAGTTTTVGSGGEGTSLALQATGTGTANAFGAATWNSGTTFRFAGGGTANGTGSGYSTLTSTGAGGIGALTIQSGTLRVAQSSLATQAVLVSGGALNFNGTSAGALTLASGQNFTQSGGILEMTLGSSSDQIVGSSSGAFFLSGGTLWLDMESGFNYSASYNLFSGFGSGTISGLTIANYDSSNYLAHLDNSGILSFATVPEPNGRGLLGLGAVVVALILYRRKLSALCLS